MNKEKKKTAGAAKAFGTLLRFYRERAAISQEALGLKTGYSKSQVAMIERGERRARGDFVEIADGLLGAQGALLAVAEEVTISAMAAWFEDYLAEEAKAASIQAYENQLVPGLLQTPEYARAVFGCASPPWEDEEVDAMVAARMNRHEVFHRRPLPLIRFVLEKSALKRPIGGRPCLKRNLLHILEVSQLRNVEIQVMPEDCETHAGLSGPFILLETAERKSQLVYVEGLSGRYFLTEQPELGDAFARFGTLRAQALSPGESYKLIEQVAREL
ncbi:helix-turn-helix domain-containing protein [Streptomyces sp. NPDC098101]|uniref:helix-turn-helix domain-containing protein n=1 Tax=Streptomyces sp. NPDC098101 TaxID=3366096 RepID=UPI003814A0C4